ncbi:Protein mlp1 [Massospora cicadina]|nr:Protein mlp1 [Massospora cicadina]
MENVSPVNYQLVQSLGIDTSTLVNLEVKAESDEDLKALLLGLKGYFGKDGCQLGQLDSEQRIHSLEIKVQESEILQQEIRGRSEALEAERDALVLRRVELERETVQLKTNEVALLSEIRELQGQVQERSGKAVRDALDNPSLNKALEKIAQLEAAVSNFKAEKLFWESEKLNFEGQIKNLKQASELLRRELEEKANSEKLIESKGLPAEVEPSEEVGEALGAAVQCLADDPQRPAMPHQISEQLKTIEELRSQLALQADYKFELEAQSKLLEHHRNSHTEMEAQCSELRALKERYASLVRHSEDYEAETLSAHHKLTAQITQLQNQLNERSAAPIDAEKPYADTFNDYVQAKRELLESQSNSKELQLSLDLLTTEFEEQAPLLKELRLDYDRLLDEANLMAELLNQVKVDYFSALEMAKAREATLKQEISHLKAASQAPIAETSEESSNSTNRLQERIVELKQRVEEQQTQFPSEIKKLEASLEEQWCDKVKALEKRALGQAARIRALEGESNALNQMLSKSQLAGTETTSQKDEEVAGLLKEKLELQSACKELGINFDQLKAQHDLLKRDKDEKTRQAAHLEAQLQQHKESKVNLDQALLQASNARAECDLIKKSEERLHHENKFLMQEKIILNGRMIDLQLKIDALVQKEASGHQQALAQILALEEERDAVTSALESARAEISNQQQAHAKAAQEYQLKVDELNASIHAAQEKLMVASEAFKNSEVRLKALESENKRIVGMVESISGAESLKDELFTTLSQLQEAQEALTLSQQSESQFCAISKASEEALQALGRTYEDYKASTSKTIAEKECKIQSDASLLSEQALTLQRLTEERDGLSEELVSSTRRFQQQIANLDDEITRLKETVSKAGEQQLNSDKQEMDAKLDELSKSDDYLEAVRQHAEAQSTILHLNQEILSLKVAALKARISELQDTNNDLQTKPCAIPMRWRSSSPMMPYAPSQRSSNFPKLKPKHLKPTNRRLEHEKKRLLEQLLSEKDGRWQPGSQAAEQQAHIEELTRNVKILSESSAYLRQENQSLASQFASMEDRYQALLGEQQLTQEHIQSLEYEMSSKDKALQEAHDEAMKLKAKLHEILEKTNIVSLEEHTQLKTHLSQAKDELLAVKAALEKSTADFRELSTSSEATITELKDKITKLNRTGLHFKRSYDQLKAESLQTDSKLLASKLEEANKAKLDLEVKVAELSNQLSSIPQGEGSDIQKLKDSLEKASKVHETDKERYVKLREVAIKMKHQSAEKSAENARLKEDLDKMASAHALKEDEIKQLTDSLTAMTAQNEALGQEVATAANKLMEAMEENSTKLERLELEKSLELSAVREESEAKLARLEMRHRAQLGRPQKLIEKLKGRIATLKAQLPEECSKSEMLHSPKALTGIFPGAPLEGSKQKPGTEPAVAASNLPAKQPPQDQPVPLLEASHDPIGSPPMATTQGNHPDLVDEIVTSLEVTLPPKTLKRSSSPGDEIIDLDAPPTKKPQTSTPKTNVTPGFVSPLVDPQLTQVSPSILELDLPKAESSSLEPKELESETFSDG